MHTHIRPLAALALAAALFAAGAAMASEKLAKDTGKSCTYCHDKPGSRLLTDPGKYYETMSTLTGYEAMQSTFGRCTNCHVRRPGSHKLTSKGRQFAGLAQDMVGLQKWMRDNHPAPARK